MISPVLILQKWTTNPFGAGGAKFGSSSTAATGRLDRGFVSFVLRPIDTLVQAVMENKKDLYSTRGSRLHRLRRASLPAPRNSCSACPAHWWFVVPSCSVAVALIVLLCAVLCRAVAVTMLTRLDSGGALVTPLATLQKELDNLEASFARETAARTAGAGTGLGAGSGAGAASGAGAGVPAVGTEERKQRKQRLRAIMRAWLPLERCVLRLVVNHLPSPVAAQQASIRCGED